MQTPLSYFFSPQGVAIIGASANPNKLSHGILRNLKQSHFQGKVYPVNPGAKEILGMTSYPDIASVPDPVELAVIVLPAPATVDVLDACGQRGIKAVTIISGGFREVGKEGLALEERCLEVARHYGMRLIGPNCVGTMDLHSGLNTTFIHGVPDQGHIGFISQSGAICGGVVDYIRGKRVGFSHFISLGNEADISETDMIEYLGSDPNTRVIAAYVEAIRDGQRFIEVARRVSREKPIVMIKAGRSNAGARAVSSHTGSLAGAYAAYQAAFEQSGVIEVDQVADLFDVALALSFQPIPTGNRTVILTNAGGPAALASDSLSSNGLCLEDLTPETTGALRKKLNPSAQVTNPVDMLGGAEPHEYRASMDLILQDPNVDIVIPILVPQALVNPVEVARQISEAAQNSTKTVISCIMGDESVDGARQVLHENHVPMFVFPEIPGQVLGAMIRYGRWKERGERHLSVLTGFGEKRARQVIEQSAGAQSMGEASTRPLLEAYGIRVIPGEAAYHPREAVEIAHRFGTSVALKIISPDILHKSDAGGIQLNLNGAEMIETAYQRILDNCKAANPEAHLEGVLVEAMAPKGQEVIIGMRRDPNFGPLMMFGLGGIYVELFGDVAFRVAPISHEEALEMINKTHAGKLLTGFRGSPAADIAAVVDCIERLSKLSMDFPEISEIEVNPLLVLPEGKGAVALDCRVILS